MLCYDDDDAYLVAYEQRCIWSIDYGDVFVIAIFEALIHHNAGAFVVQRAEQGVTLARYVTYEVEMGRQAKLEPRIREQ